MAHPFLPLWAGGFGWTVVGLAVPLVLAGVVALAFLFPAIPFALLTRLVYRMRVRGRENVPAHGGALLVCNPVTYLDVLLLLRALPRPGRILVRGGGAHVPGAARLLRRAGAIVCDGSGGRAQLDEAMRQAAEALRRGELLCLFAEGRRLKGAGELPWHQACEGLLREVPVPVIPVCLTQMWGTLYRRDGEHYRWQWPQEFPYSVWVDFAGPLPPTARPWEVRQALQRLSAECAVRRNRQRPPVHRQFVRMAARYPLRTCIIDSSLGGKRLSYARAYAGATCLARLLRPLVGETRMVGVWLPPSAGGALSNLALTLLGKVAVNLNYTSSANHIRSALSQCACRHVLTSRRFVARMPLPADLGAEVVYLEDFLPRVSGLQKLRALLEVLLLPGWFLDRVVLKLGGHRLDDLATVIFSSGSTGDPKGVMLSHGNVAGNLESMIQVAGLSRHDRLLAVLPFFHSFGYTVTLWGHLQVGASAVYHADPRQAKQIGALCREHRCTLYLTTATFLRFSLKKSGPEDFRSLRLLMCGAEKLPVALAEDFARKFGITPLEGYGCTELSPVVAANMPDIEVNGCRELSNRPGTVGPPLPGVVGKVAHPETGQDLPAGEEGVLLVYGPNVMRGYLGKPDLTREAIRDGWYVTGDMARIDADGFITLTGRLSRFAKVGGEMVPLEKVEEELHEAAGTCERICSVTCVSDPARGERIVVLYLRDRLAEQGLEVRPWWEKVNGRGLPNLWVPAERDFVPVEELPLLGTGKVNLQRVKELAAELARR
jgi:acyl-[acyl-carrier-protein]-phospholipid O-acyltransferase/long-chain-fatty-acid--[acyl-carrier-protein] ligase